MNFFVSLVYIGFSASANQNLTQLLTILRDGILEFYLMRHHHALGVIPYDIKTVEHLTNLNQES